MLKESQTDAVQSWETVPVTVPDHFELIKANFKSFKFYINVLYLSTFILFEKFFFDNLRWEGKLKKIKVKVKLQHIVSIFFNREIYGALAHGEHVHFWDVYWKLWTQGSIKILLMTLSIFHWWLYLYKVTKNKIIK